MSSENTNFDNQSGMGDAEIKQANPIAGWFPVIVIVSAVIISYIVYFVIFGDGSNFQGGDNANDPLPGNYFGIIYKGGLIIPIGFAALLTLVTFFIERMITLGRAKGKGAIDVFVKKIRMKLHNGDIDGALEECDLQRGSVANVIRAGLQKYKEVENDASKDKDQKKLAIQAELEEATNLELPMLEKNLVIIATIVSVGVLIGLFGTVMGMIKAFSALATAGAPDASELATGISEALVNTAVGILNSALAIMVYNFFTTDIDSLTYSIDEAGYSIIQTFDLGQKS